MMFTLKKSITHLVLIALLVISAPSQAFSFLDSQKAVNPDSLTGKGRWTLFEIWDSSCHICRETIHEINRFQAAYPQAQVFGISTDSKRGRQDALNFAREHQLKFPNLLSHFVEVSDYLYSRAGERLLGTPTVMLFTPEGDLLAVQPGPVTAQELINFIRKEEQQRNTP